MYEELLEEQTRVHQLAGKEGERGGAVETLLGDATHRLPVFPIWREHNARRKVHTDENKDGDRRQRRQKGSVEQGARRTASRPW